MESLSLSLSLSPFLFHFSTDQASTHCADAKDYLEMMCREMAGELAHFDLQKEKELKQVLLEYTAAQLERHEKVKIATHHFVMYTLNVGGSGNHCQVSKIIML